MFILPQSGYCIVFDILHSYSCNAIYSNATLFLVSHQLLMVGQWCLVYSYIRSSTQQFQVDFMFILLQSCSMDFDILPYIDLILDFVTWRYFYILMITINFWSPYAPWVHMNNERKIFFHTQLTNFLFVFSNTW